MSERQPGWQPWPPDPDVEKTPSVPGSEPVPSVPPAEPARPPYQHPPEWDWDLER